MTQPTILITRDAAGGKQLAESLEQRIGNAADILCMPLFLIHYADTSPPIQHSDIIITSMHAAQFYQTLNHTNKDVKFYVVGTETAAYIEQHGLGDVCHIAPSAMHLAEHLKGQQLKAMTYLRGADITLDMQAALASAGVLLDQHIVYHVNTDAAAFASFRSWLEGRTSPVILPLLSKRTAKIVAEHAASSACTPLFCIALSKAVAAATSAATSEEKWADIVVAEKADRASLANACLKLLDRLLSGDYDKITEQRFPQQ